MIGSSIVALQILCCLGLGIVILRAAGVHETLSISERYSWSEMESAIRSAVNHGIAHGDKRRLRNAETRAIETQRTDDAAHDRKQLIEVNVSNVVAPNSPRQENGN